LASSSRWLWRHGADSNVRLTGDCGRRTFTRLLASVPALLPLKPASRARGRQPFEARRHSQYQMAVHVGPRSRDFEMGDHYTWEEVNGAPFSDEAYSTLNNCIAAVGGLAQSCWHWSSRNGRHSGAGDRSTRAGQVHPAVGAWGWRAGHGSHREPKCPGGLVRRSPEPPHHLVRMGLARRLSPSRWSRPQSLNP
jgi:hypothetical protein